MARIAETELQHLKAAASLAVVVQVQGRQAMLARVSAFYYQTLQNAAEAITYLEKRRQHHPAASGRPAVPHAHGHRDAVPSVCAHR
ncbi:hypothetical protein [Pseudomonas cerasi]